MAGEWNETTLSDVSRDVSYGYTESATSEMVGPKFLRITDIQGGVVNWESVPYCPISEDNHDKYKLANGDIVVARTGNSTGENYLFRGGADAVFASYLIRFRLDTTRVDPRFIWYNLRVPRWWEFINSSKTGSAQAGANAKVLGRFPLRLPPLPEQQAIACILGALDDKIALNRRMNRTLEEMARAIFRSWFVDFDPVRAKAALRRQHPNWTNDQISRAACPNLNPEIAALFPDSFEDSELGEIPRGWRVGKVGEICEFAYGKALKADQRKAGSVPVMGSNGQVGVHDQALVKGPGIIVGRKGNPGIVKWVNTDFFPIDTTFYVVPSGKEYPLTYLCYALEHLSLARFGADSAVPGLNRQIAYGTQLVIPDSKVLESFGCLATSIRDRQHATETESRTLAALRDALLPKLISGELRVQDAERIVGRCL